MSKSITSKLLLLFTACGLVAVLSLGGPLVSQEKKEAAPKPEKKERAEPKGRLPNFYADVVTGDQREKIYAIQQKYAEQLDELTEQIKALANDRDEEIQAVLTPEQKDKVAKAIAAAKAKRKAAAELKKAEKEKEKEATKAPAAGGATAPKKE